VAQLGDRLEQRRPAAVLAGGLVRVACDDEHVVCADRVDALQDLREVHRSRTSRAEMCGTTLYPCLPSRSATSSVCSIPFRGDTVTVRVTSVGTCSSTDSSMSPKGALRSEAIRGAP
jgi:hypothetical protein